MVSLVRVYSARLLLVIAAAIWVGCEASPFPLDEKPAIPVDETLLGTWDIQPPGEEGRMIITAAGEFEYEVLYLEGTADDEISFGDSTLVLVHLSALDGQLFVNIMAGDDEEGEDVGWLFMVYDRTSPNEMLLTPLEDDFYDLAKDLPDVASVVEALREWLTRSDAFSEAATFRKVR